MQNNEKFSENPNLFPITLHEGVHVVDSRLIGEALGIVHKNLLETLNKHLETIESNFQRGRV